MLIPMFPVVRPWGRTGGVFSLVADTVRVAVFIDWQNVYLTAREVFGLEEEPRRRGSFSPHRLGCLLAAANSRRDKGELVRVEIHRGLPSQKHDPNGYAAARRQLAAWKSESQRSWCRGYGPCITGTTQPNHRPEKGVDVALAVSVIEAILTDRCDVALAAAERPKRRRALQTTDFAASAIIAA
jgi:hypothetical protein